MNNLAFKQILLITNVILLLVMVVASAWVLANIFPINISGDMRGLGIAIVAIEVLISTFPVFMQGLIVWCILKAKENQVIRRIAKISFVFSFLILTACFMILLSSINIQNPLQLVLLTVFTVSSFINMLISILAIRKKLK